MKRALYRLAGVASVALLLVVVLALLVPALLGFQRYVITGGSMTGAIAKGSVIYSKLAPVEELKAGDIITFEPPGHAALVTHRIVAVEAGPDGTPVFRTKGDFNDVADPWGPITLNEPEQARYVFDVPLLGYLLAALAIRTVRVALIGVPAVIIALSLLWGLWRQAGEEVARQLEDDGVPHDGRSRA